MTAKKDKISIEFIGENSHDVTGSCIWIKTPHRQILLELGLWQSAGETLDTYKINNAHFKFKPSEIDYVFINHAHVDHCGRLPILYKRGGHAPAFVPEMSGTLIDILLRDSAKIASVDAAELSKKYGREYAPIYTDEDVDAAMNHICGYKFGETIILDEYVKFRFTPSGHILNAAQLELWITEGNLTKKISYTSDLGNVHVKKRYVEAFAPIKKSDIFIGECTYGGEHRIADQASRNKDREKLKSVIDTVCLNDGGRVLIPVFANARAQEILTDLYDLYGHDPLFRIPVLLDTPMGIRVCRAYDESLELGDDEEIWKAVMNWDNLFLISDQSDSKAWQMDNRPAVVLSSSGMMTHGRSRVWCKELLENPKNAIVFCGFSVQNSLASIIKSGKAKTILLGGKRVKNKCNIVDLHSYSSHMQRDSLLDYYSSVECSKIILVHGEMDGKIEFAEELKERISKNNNTSKVVCTNKDYSIVI